MSGDGRVDPFHHATLDVLRRGSRVLWEIPVGAQRELARGAPLQPVARLELADVLERARGRRDIAQLEVGVERLPVELAGGEPRGDESLELRGEGNPPRARDDVERLDPEPVPREQQGLGGGVPNGEGKHPTKWRDAVGTALFVQVQHGLGVAV